MKRYLVTACDSTFAYQALNLIGSAAVVQAGIKAIRVYDLGLTARQRAQFMGIKGVELKSVPSFTPHWQQCYSWKPWVMIDAAKDFNELLYLDAGTELLQSPDEIYSLIEKDGYFLVSQADALAGGHTLGQIIPSDYYRQFGLAHQHDGAPVIAAGLVGFRTSSAFYIKILPPWLKLVKEGWNLGWSKNELSRNHGLHALDRPPIRDCQLFRHDQTLFNLLVYKHLPSAHLQSMERFGTMHRLPDVDQVLWSPKLAGSFRHVGHIPYVRNARLYNARNRSFVAVRSLKRKLRP